MRSVKLPLYRKLIRKLKTFLRDMLNRKEIDKKIMDYLIMKKPQLDRFYLLPKVQKRRTIIPGRPVISSNGTATENISSLLNFHLKRIVSTVPHIFIMVKSTS